MNLITAGVTSAIIVAGAAGSVTAYRAKAAPTGEVVSVSPKPAEPQAVVQWAPCEEPGKLVDDVCVTDVVRTVMRPAPPASRPATSGYSGGYAAQPPAGAAPARAVAAYEGRRVEREDFEEYENEDFEEYENEDSEDHENEDSEDHENEDSEDHENEDSEDHADEDHADEDHADEDHENED